MGTPRNSFCNAWPRKFSVTHDYGNKGPEAGTPGCHFLNLCSPLPGDSTQQSKGSDIHERRPPLLSELHAL